MASKDELLPLVSKQKRRRCAPPLRLRVRPSTLQHQIYALPSAKQVTGDRAANGQVKRLTLAGDVANQLPKVAATLDPVQVDRHGDVSLTVMGKL
jgi:hypothetical protein